MNETHSDNKKLAARLDIMPMAVSLALILALCLAFFLAPEQSKHVLDSVRFFIGEEFGVYYLAVGLGIFLLSLYLAFSPFGTIRLGGAGRKSSVFCLFLGRYDVHLRSGGRHPFLFSVRMDSLCQ